MTNTLFRFVVLLVFGGVTVAYGAPKKIKNCDNSVWDKAVQSYVLANDISSDGTDCLVPTVSDITINGAGHRISSGDSNAVRITNQSGIKVQNIVSDSGVQIYGDKANGNTIQNSKFQSISIYMGDDNAILNNTLSGFVSQSLNNNPTYRTIFNGNTVDGDAADLVEFVGENHPCPRTEYVIKDNQMTNHRTGTPDAAWAVFRVRCGTHNIISGNTVVATGTTIPFYIRDEMDDSLISGNRFVANSQEAVRIASGNVDKTFPARNKFKANEMFSQSAVALFMQASGSQNRFEQNVIWTKGPDFAVFAVGGNGAVFDHNTFYSAGNRLLNLSYRTSPTDTYTNNILAFKGQDIFGLDGWDFDRYEGDHNLFYGSTGTIAYANFGNLRGWKRASGSDENSIEKDPQFVDADNGDFHLQKSSPARGAADDGTNLGANPDLIEASLIEVDSGCSTSPAGAAGLFILVVSYFWFRRAFATFASRSFT